MEKVYIIIFLVGVIYTIVTFLMGSLFSFMHLDGHIDTHIDGHIGSHLDSHIEGAGTSPTLTVSPLKPIVIVSFITVFGGIGVIGTHYGLNSILTFLLALISARIVSHMLYKCVVIPLYKAQNTSAVFQQSLVGTRAVVISPIIEGGFGVISYIVNGSKHNAPAKHINKQFVSQGEEVIIYDIRDNVFYVQPINEKSKNLQI